MERNEHILRSVEGLLEGSEYDVVDVVCTGTKQGLTVRLLVDKEGGVTLEDCARVSRAVGDHFEATQVITSRYVLEVSSPGVDRPLRRPADFVRFKDETATVSTYEKVDGRHNHTGVLVGFDQDQDAVLLRMTDQGQVVSIPRGAIRKAQLKRDPWGSRPKR